jgi:LysM repeat protein
MTQPPIPSVKANPIRKARHRQKARHASSLRQILFWIAILLIFSACLFIPLITGLTYYLSIQASDKIFNHLETAGIEVGGKTLDQVAVLLHQTWNIDNQITVTDGNSTLIISPQTLGIRLDPVETATRAYQYGRHGSIFQRISEIMDASGNPIQLDPVVTIDINQAKLGIQEIANTLDKPALEAQFIIQNGDPQVLPGEPGHAIHQLHALSILSSEPAAILFGGKLDLLTQPLQPTIQDLTFLAEEARQILDRTLEIRIYDPLLDEAQVFPLSRELIASWLVAENTSSGPQLTFAVDKINTFLTEINQKIGPERTIDLESVLPQVVQGLKEGNLATTVIHYNPTTYTVQAGDTLLRIGWKVGMPYWKIAKANPDIDPDKLIAGQELVIPSKEDNLPLPIIPGKRIVINIAKQRLWAYQNGEVVSKQVISTGIDKSPTQPGIFQVQSHVPNAYASVWDLYMPNFLGVYEAWPGFMNGIHGLPTLSNGNRLWANVLGKPASYGCIILGLEPAEWLYQWAEDGVIVEIQP